jgi:hypothetical protein
MYGWFLSDLARRAALVISAAKLAFAAIGCSDSTHGAAPTGGAAGIVQAGSEAGATAGWSSRFTIGGGFAAPIQCGSDTCEGSFFVAACCTTANTCGFGTADECLESNQEGTLDARCADQALIAFGSFAKGCCKANGNCGLMIERPGLGCVERTSIPSWASSGNDWTASACAEN